MESTERPGENKLPNPPINPLRQNMLEVYPAGLGVRAIAFILDCVMIGAITYLILTTILFPIFHPGFLEAFRTFIEQQQSAPNMSFFEMMDAQLKFEMQHQQAFLESQYLFVMIVWIYFAMSEILMQGSTLGKKVFRLQTIDLNTLKNPSGKTILIRNCLKTISMTILPPLLLINFIIPLFNRFRLAGHDLLSKTMITYQDTVPPAAKPNDP